MKKLLALLLAIVMVAGLAACGQQAAAPAGENAPTNAAEAIQESSTEVDNTVEVVNTGYIKDYIALNANAVTSLTPWGTSNSTPGNYEVYEMLYECDALSNIYPLLADASRGGSYIYKGEPLPGCDHEEGTAVYDVYINDCIYDQKGEHITASDVAFSYNWQLTNEAVSGWNSIVSVEAVDDTTVRFTFDEEVKGVGGMTDIFCRCFIVSEKTFTESGDQLVGQMCGTGPYKFVSFDGTVLTLERDENYWQLKAGRTPRQEQMANVKTVAYRLISEPSQIVIGLQTGDLTCCPEFNRADDALTFANDAKFQVTYYAQKFVNYLNPNCDAASPMNDVNLRKAVLYAVDIDGFVQATGGTYERLYAYANYYGGYSDASWFKWEEMDNYNTYDGGAIEGVGANRAEVVKYYLDQSSYKGEKLVILCQGDSADSATVIAAQLAQYGINAEVKSVDRNSARTVQGDPTQWDLELGMMAGDNIAVVWDHGFGTAKTGTGKTSNYIEDKEWNDLLVLCNTADGHTKENMEAWWQHAVDNAYTMGLFTTKTYMVLPSDMINVVQGDKLTFLPGACTWAAPEA
ncbi:MAG: ABC transporter substrate-binding protein [Clostridia bacterium]|nr:ABC transporter substrate-binding protein [Clostridia bacterium]